MPDREKLIEEIKTLRRQMGFGEQEKPEINTDIAKMANSNKQDLGLNWSLISLIVITIGIILQILFYYELI
ncbi:hypothetical protein [Fodinibius sp.]|uniref:hypothetical protein n=1 Tax=Fodinibius sp. TaxID=1872440 RepID=UPI002ACE2B29|nr:hypothetical protein [Fodinibius sp.]MDZ7660061.1 hypothetical protein [Fodinibius sp.]